MPSFSLTKRGIPPTLLVKLATKNHGLKDDWRASPKLHIETHPHRADNHLTNLCIPNAAVPIPVRVTTPQLIKLICAELVTSLVIVETKVRHLAPFHNRRSHPNQPGQARCNTGSGHTP